jgi:hypothetical protein
MKKERISLNDGILDIMMKMSDGNPGAITVLTRMVKEGGAIDPVNVFGGYSGILSLDTHGIYGSRIWMLYKDVCGEDLVKTLGVLRACQLGFASESAINHAIDNYGQGLDVANLVQKVKEQLPEFGIVP